MWIFSGKLKTCVWVCSVVSDSLRPRGLLAYEAPLPMEFSRQEFWSGVPFPSPGNLPGPRDWTCISCISCISRGIQIRDQRSTPYSNLCEGVNCELIVDGQVIVIMVKNLIERDVLDGRRCEGTQVRRAPLPPLLSLCGHCHHCLIITAVNWPYRDTHTARGVFTGYL